MLPRGLACPAELPPWDLARLLVVVASLLVVLLSVLLVVVAVLLVVVVDAAFPRGEDNGAAGAGDAGGSLGLGIVFCDPVVVVRAVGLVAGAAIPLARGLDGTNSGASLLRLLPVICVVCGTVCWGSVLWSVLVLASVWEQALG